MEVCRIAQNPETALQNEIMAALCKQGCMVFRRNTGLYYTKDGRPVQIGKQGQADLSGHRCADGKAWYIEVKMPGEEPRPDQRKFLEAMRRTGAIAGVAHSVDEAINIVGG